MRHTHSFLIKVYLPLLLLMSFALPLLSTRIPWYVFCIIIPLVTVLAVITTGKLLLVKERRRIQAEGKTKADAQPGAVQETVHRPVSEAHP